jgi:hypothetical protein
VSSCSHQNPLHHTYEWNACIVKTWLIIYKHMVNFLSLLQTVSPIRWTASWCSVVDVPHSENFDYGKKSLPKDTLNRDFTVLRAGYSDSLNITLKILLKCQFTNTSKKNTQLTPFRMSAFLSCFRSVWIWSCSSDTTNTITNMLRSQTFAWDATSPAFANRQQHLTWEKCLKQYHVK